MECVFVCVWGVIFTPLTPQGIFQCSSLKIQKNSAHLCPMLRHFRSVPYPSPAPGLQLNLTSFSLCSVKVKVWEGVEGLAVLVAL